MGDEMKFLYESVECNGCGRSEQITKNTIIMPDEKNLGFFTRYYTDYFLEIDVFHICSKCIRTIAIMSECQIIDIVLAFIKREDET